MSFTVYHIKSTQSINIFGTAGGAKRSVTCSNKNAGSVQYAYADTDEYYKNVVKMKKVVNLMSGTEIEIPSNTPRACDPSTELYWSM